VKEEKNCILFNEVLGESMSDHIQNEGTEICEVF
jgi:hypothetical protein